MLSWHLVAGRLDSRSVLVLCDLPDVLTAAVDEQVPDAAHVAVVQHGGPQLGWENQPGSGFRKTAEVHVPLKVQDLVFATGGEGGAAAVDGYGACRYVGKSKKKVDFCLKITTCCM